ncbi:MAG: zinc metalloprotease HtpX [Sedimentisphaerales bacterium]|nr:zinc metalloprotease HtpX [Sedimentisphaerales bacterium]
MRSFLNGFKTTVLMAGLMGLCLGIGYVLGHGKPQFMLMALMVGGVMNFIAYFFSDKIALMTMQAKEIKRADDVKLWDTVERLCHRAELPMPRVYVSPAAAPNAFATGRNPHHSAVCVTEGLRRILNDNELSGVIAHELSHIKNRDILISTVAATIAGAISYLGHMAFFFGGGSRDDRNSGSNPLVALMLMIIAPIAAMLIQMAISRSREYAADAAGAEIAGSPDGLAKALEKLSNASKQIPLPVSNSQANMFIVAPLTGEEMASLFTTHPPIKKRIARLMEMKRPM